MAGMLFGVLLTSIVLRSVISRPGVGVDVEIGEENKEVSGGHRSKTSSSMGGTTQLEIHLAESLGGVQKVQMMNSCRRVKIRRRCKVICTNGTVRRCGNG